MKKLLLSVFLVSCASAATAAEIRSTIVDSVQLTVDAPGVQSTRIGSQYSVSGTNIDVTTLGGMTIGSATAPPTLTDGSYAIDTNGQAFTFSESSTVGDVAVTSQTSMSSGGRVDTPNIYGSSMQYQGGTPGSLAGTLSATGIPTVTAGGAGTSAIGQRTVELTVFN